MRFSLGSGFLYINKHVYKQICPVWLQVRKDWIHAPVEAPLWGGGGRDIDIPPFCFGVRLFARGGGGGGARYLFSPFLLWGSFV